MYKCDKCGNSSNPGDQQIKAPTEIRKKIYHGGAIGWEIAKETKFCMPCATKYLSEIRSK
jgi:hypothetical protein